MKRRTRIIVGSITVLGIGAAGFAVSSARGASESDGPASVAVERGDLVAKALAVGTIVPDVQVSVKAKISGVAGRAYAEAGDYVREGAPLLEIRPDPTPLELVESRRQLELRQIELANHTRGGADALVRGGTQARGGRRAAGRG